MSNYRDDALDTLRLSDETWVIIRSNADEVIRLSESTLTILGISHFDELTLGDEVLERASINAFDQFSLSDSETGQRIASSYSYDNIKLGDLANNRFYHSVEDTMQLGDQSLSIIGSRSIDRIVFGDMVQSQRIASAKTYDQFKLSDSANTVYAEQVTDSILLGDFTQSKCYSTAYSIDTFILGDEDLSTVQLYTHAVDSLKLGDFTQSKLTARNNSNDYFSLFDEIKDSKLHGQAWTANTDTWAMSRYMPYAFEGLTVINDQLYGWNDQGVFLMGKPDSNVNGFIQTGKLDFGDNLVHPTAAFLEYEMTGMDKQLDISVTTTQSGQPSTYNYVLPSEVADHLTNGRIVFGRGLRGRHFAFGISIAAQTAKINALSLEFTQTARRV